jgi:tripeptide aminopeptidase
MTKRFLNYVSFDTQSDETSAKIPSTAKQLLFAQALKSEAELMGLTEISLDKHAYLMATLPANTDENLPVIGFVAHMDTSPDVSGANVKSRIVTCYDGMDIVLNEKENIILSPETFPELLQHTGEDIIVTDGTTLLGADDKAGIAEIMTAVQYLIDHPEIKHGKIRIAFTPDEEIGRSASLFDVKKFGCDWAYTVDGGNVGELQYENFNAAAVKIKIKGLNVHPGYAANKMRNAGLVAIEFNEFLPPNDIPEYTSGYEGFFHLTGIKGTVEEAELSYIVRDFSAEWFERRLQYMQAIVDDMNTKYDNSIQLEIKRQYRNMREIVKPQKHIIDLAVHAMEEAGVTPVISPIRGGTDGAHLSFKGLPCPNIFTGSMNLHGRYEWISVQVMEMAVQVIVGIATSSLLVPTRFSRI